MAPEITKLDISYIILTKESSFYYIKINFTKNLNFCPPLKQSDPNMHFRNMTH